MVRFLMEERRTWQWQEEKKRKEDAEVRGEIMSPIYIGGAVR